MGDARKSSQNEHSLHDQLLDEPNIGELHDDDHALDNMGLAPENAYVMCYAWKTMEARILPMRPIGVDLLTSTLEDGYPHPTSH